MSNGTGKNENDYQNEILKLLTRNKNLMNKINSEDLKIECEVPVPYRVSFFENGKTNNIKIYCYNQDICIYKKFPISEFRNISFSKTRKNQDNSKFEDEAKEEIGLPYVILELKMGRNFTTEGVLAYSQKAQSIKSIFPSVRYALVVIGNIAERFYQHGYIFDRIIEISEDKFKETVDDLAVDIESMIKESISRKEKK